MPNPPVCGPDCYNYAMTPARLATLLLLAATVAAQLAPVPALHLISAPLLVCVWPGIAAACWLGLTLDLRDARTHSVVLTASLALAPLSVFALSAVVPFSAPAAVLSLSLLTAVGLLAAPRAATARDPLPLSRGFLLVSALTLFAIALALAPMRNAYRDSILPLQPTVELTDWPKHYALVWEIEQSGVPPRNLLFLQNPPASHVYHIFFHMTVALLDLLADRWLGITSWLVGGALLAAYTLLVSLYAVARVLWKDGRAATAAIVAASLMGGLDALPNAVAIARDASEPLFRHLDGWTSCQAEISNFFTIFTWVPQHAIALAIVFGAWLVYADERRGRWRAPVLIALLLVASVGYSIYVPLGVALGIACFTLLGVVQQIRARSGAGALAAGAPWIVAGLAGIVALAPLAAYELSARLPGAGLPVALWVHSAGLPISAFAPAAPFQFFAPRGGIIAQLLDLPAYWLFELGAALPLGLIGVLAAGGDRRRDAWRIGLLVAAASLLVSTFARSTLGCNDLGLRSGLPFQGWLALMAGGGWLALRGTFAVGAGEQPARLRLPNLRATAALAALTAAGALVAYQIPMAYRYDLLADRFAPVSGLYDMESAGGQTFRWTRSEVQVTFNDIAQNTDYRLEVRARAGTRPPGAPPAYALVRVNDQLVGSFTAHTGADVLTLDLPPDLVRAGSSLRVTLFIVPSVPDRFGLGDRRELGFLLDEIALAPMATTGIALPPWDVLIACTSLAILVAIQTRPRRTWAAVPLLVAVGLTLARAPAAAALPFIALALALLWCARRGAPLFAARLRNLLATGSTRVLLASTAPLMAIGVLTVSWIVLSYDLSRFLPPADAASAERDAYSLAYAGAVRAVRERTPAGAVVQLDPHRGGHMGWGLIMERRNYFVADEVFAYQFPPALRETRMVRVSEAYDMPTLFEACDRFRRLGIDIVVVEPHASAYSWLADIDEPEACLHPLYADPLVAVLELRP
ncbi:MAG: hypothetical protein HZB53_20110 [Chloroflexi bacterium]|nr:hypothetical protein [Chloroflexota bacterium]